LELAVVGMDRDRDEVSFRWGVRIPMRDGVHLSATVYLPRMQSAPAPAILTLTPYIAQGCHERGVYFAAHGFPYVVADVRGRGNSEGEFDPSINEAADAHDAIEWLARESYCNGRVSMWGGSYGGYIQWAVAKELPAHLATIVPVAAPFMSIDSPMCKNVFRPYRIQWLTMISGRTSQERIFADQAFWNQQFRHWFESGTPFANIDSALGNPSAIFQKWMEHPHCDAFWDRYNPRPEHYAALSMPVLTITGAYDGNQLGALTHYREHLRNCSTDTRGRHYLIIGPWDHAGTRAPAPKFCGIECGPASLLDLGKLHLEWYAWTMQSGPKPAFLRKNVAYYVMGAEEWRYADSLEQVTAYSMPLHLRSVANPIDVFRSGMLAEKPAPVMSEPDHYVYDPRDVSLAALESSIDPESKTDHRLVHAAVGKQLVYHSEPLDAALDICGFFKLTAWLAIDQADTDFCVSVYEVAGDGSSILLSSDLIRARYRESLREPRLIRTDEPLRYDFQRFAFVARRLAKGHRLRLTIGPLNSIYSEKNYNGGGEVAKESVADARTVTVKLFHGEAHPSALYVPIGNRSGD
jgi:uncharacterized protein